MSSKSSQVNNLALGGYSGVRFLFTATKVQSIKVGKLTAPSRHKLTTWRLGATHRADFSNLAEYKLIAWIDSSKLSQANNPALGGYKEESFLS